MNILELRKQCQTCQHFDWQLHKYNHFFCAMHPHGQLNCPDHKVNLEVQKRLEANKRAVKRSQQISAIKFVLFCLIGICWLAVSIGSIKALGLISPTSLASMFESNQFLEISLINKIYLMLSLLLIPYFLRELKKEIKWFKSLPLNEEIYRNFVEISSLIVVLLLLMAAPIIILIGMYYQIEPASSFIEASFCYCLIPFFLLPRQLMNYLLRIESL